MLKSKEIICSLAIICALVSGYSVLSAQDKPAYDPKGRRDPFVPLVTPDGRLLKLESQQPTAGLTLEGIIYDEHGLSYAIVNGEVVRISDRVGEYQVLKILKNKVIFIKGAETTEVELKEDAN
jgi:hypothetical protein